MKSGESGEKIGKMIKKAIEDGRLTNSEYEKILAIAEADLVIDSQEKKLLAELQELLANKTVIRVPDLFFLEASLIDVSGSPDKQKRLF